MIRTLAVLLDGTIVRFRLQRGEEAVPRATMDAYGHLTFEGYTLDLANERLLHEGEVVPLAPKAFVVLRRLVEEGGQVVTKKELLRAGWANTHVTDDVLKVRILEIRRALGDDPAGPRFVETVSRHGDAFIAARSCVPNSGGGYRARPARRARGRANRRPTSAQLRRVSSAASPARAAASRSAAMA
jgi:DNA-binding winged helix-turn-helix (wHTH) protein